MEESFSKYDIATFLRDYADVMDVATNNPNIPLYDIYCDILNREGRSNEANFDNYQKMINFVIFFTNIRMFSIVYDNYFQYVREEDLKDLDLSSIFIDQNDYNKFANSKKDIIKYVRNGLNHNLQNELCHYSFNDDMSYNVNISLNGTNPPFNARINYTKLLEIMFKIMYRARKCDITILKNKDTSNKKYNMRHLSNMIKNYYVRRIHPKTKNGLSSEIIDLIKLHGDGVFKNPELLNDQVDVSDYQLSWQDAYACEEKIKNLDSILSQYNYGKDLINEDLVKFVVYNTIPLGIFKLDHLNYELHMLLKARFSNVSLNQASLQAITDSDDIEVFKTVNNSWFYYMNDRVSNIFFARMLYATYMFDSVIKDENVVINNKQISKERIRNAFVHMRDYFSTNKIHLFDLTGKRRDKIINELNQESVLSISKEDLKLLLEGYYNNLKVMNDNKASSL